MPAPRSRVQSFVAAGLLSAVTLFTFYILRDYGPEKTITLFQHAVLRGDLREVARITMQPPSSPTVQRLEQFVLDAQKLGAETNVVGVQRLPGEAVFIIDYLLPSGSQRIRWVVDQDQSTGWMINADKTLGQ